MTIVADHVNVTSTAQNTVGVLGSGSSSAITWNDVIVSATVVNAKSTASNSAGLFGAGSNNVVRWTFVMVCAVTCHRHFSREQLRGKFWLRER